MPCCFSLVGSWLPWPPSPVTREGAAQWGADPPKRWPSAAAASACIVQVRMLADTKGELTKALDIELDLADLLGSKRCERYVRAVLRCSVQPKAACPTGIGCMYNILLRPLGVHEGALSPM
jgi:hypothetical protein